MTGILILVFIGIVLWAWSSRRRKDFEEAAHLPLEDEDVRGEKKEQGNGK
ncbi:MAG: cbb3-type cytochrome c oxidase subunit 3 [Halofilum sp. (in: g-proteobacteria)]|nr:cbb3-type cytochrome c oxidase subunit 3 [Halofilum sp. (in: g-proteobacteria)]